MASDGISFTFDRAGFDEMATGTVKANDKATMYAMRATGRALAKVAKASAPVYKGTDPRAVAERGNLRKSIKNAKRLDHVGDNFSLKVGPFGTKRQGTLVTRYGGKGTLSEINAAKSGSQLYYRTSYHRHTSVVKRHGNSSKGQVRGVQLYRTKMENRYHYMAKAISTSDEIAKATFEAAYDKAWAKWVATHG